VRVGDAYGDAGGRGPVTLVGPVAAGEAADFLLALAERADRRAARQALLGAVIADGADVQPGLLRLARNTALERETRQHAIGWLGELGDASLVPVLERLAREEERGIASSAAYALARLPDDAGIPSLVAFARSAATALPLRRDAVFWLGQSDARRARETVRALVQDADAPDELRAHAVFALGHGAAATQEDIDFLQRLFPTFAGRRMQDQVLMVVARNGGAVGLRWALDRARDASLGTEARKQALFWAEQGGATTAELIAVYDGLGAGGGDRALREHALFVLSRRDEGAARDKLLAIARADADRGLRKTALFWLTQKRDPRAEQLVAELLGK
jgi:HEAT repeat protein